MIRLARISLIALGLLALSACGSSESPQAPGAEAEVSANASLGSDALIEEHDEGTVAWKFDADGRATAAISSSAGAVIKDDIGGTLVYKVEGGEPKSVPLEVDAKTGWLVATGPKLEADLTEVEYTLNVSGKPWVGVLHVPVGGTSAIVASGKATAEAKLADDAVGLHGGTIQIVGDDRLELVADADTGETRVYVLDVDLRPVRVETRTLRMGFVAQKTVFVNFAPEPSGFFFVARVNPLIVVNPLRVTAAVGVGGVTHAAIWGFRPGVHIFAPTATVRLRTAPRVRFALKGGFDAGVDVYGRAHQKVVFNDDHDNRKGNNGRHVGQDGTWDRDSGGSKSPGKSAKGHDHADKGSGNAKSNSHSSSKSSSHSSSKSSSHSSSKSSSGSSSKSSGGSSSKSSGGSSSKSSSSKGGSSSKSSGKGKK